ncbi:hypothetical protein LL248_08850 [Marinomonas communis]|nr:hypothetical protein [Marinomonas communis]
MATFILVVSVPVVMVTNQEKVWGVTFIYQQRVLWLELVLSAIPPKKILMSYCQSVWRTLKLIKWYCGVT